ncbi:MAG: FlgD immunoglobulin-like domain containing protein [bacterium]
MFRKLIIHIFILGLCLSAFGQGTPHSLVGRVRNSDNSIPDPACLTFWAFYLPDSDTLCYPENSGPGEGTNYAVSEGIWLVETSSFTPPAEDGDQVYIGFYNICTDESGMTSVVLDMDLNPQELPTLTLSAVGINEIPKPDRANISISPNPFNSACRIDLPENVEFIEVYDISGKIVRTLNCNSRRVVWDGADSDGISLPSGIYFVRVPGHSIERAMFLK